MVKAVLILAIALLAAPAQQAERSDSPATSSESKSESSIAGTITNAKDQPVEGVEIVMLGAGGRVSLVDGLVDPRGTRDAQVVKSGSQGSFRFSSVKPPVLIVATHATDGYAEIFTDQITDRFEIRLLPWARLEGQLLIGDKPAADQLVTFQRLRKAWNPNHQLPRVAVRDPVAIAQILRPNAEGAQPAGDKAALQAIDLQSEIQGILAQLKILVIQRNTIKTDQAGCFAFERVAPGSVAAMRVIELQRGGLREQLPCYGVLANLAPGETDRIVIGGKGRPVIGRIEMPLIDGKPFDWSRSRAIEVGPRLAPQSEGEYYTRRFCAPAAPDGSYRFDDIPPGDYELSLRIAFPGRPTTFLRKSFTVPEFGPDKTRLDEPLDLGLLKPDINDPPAVGK